MEGYEDDDDTHFCIKCHLTIHGLENYVRHRQSGCRPPDDKTETARESPSTPTTISYPEILNADAFFSSLELQSSSKSNARRTNTLLENNRKEDKKNERRKKGQKNQPDTEDSKEKLHSMLPGDTDLDDSEEHLCIQSFVGFTDIVTSSTPNKSTSTVGASKLNQSIRHTTMNIEGSSFPSKHEPDNSLEDLVAESKQTDRKRPEENPRIEQDHQTWLDDAILVDLDENKDLARYEEFVYQEDVDSDDDMLDEDLAEDESYSESDDGEDQERPPRGHTGGKWKPGLNDLPQDIPQLQDDEVEVEEDQHSEHPPPTYTGGKWKPTESSQKVEDYQGKNTEGQPPPEHTRGKWIPGAQTDIDSGYWCNPCGRKLASRLVYNRHLLSDLHARRSIREIDDGVHLPRDATSTRRMLTRRQVALAEKSKRTSVDKEVKKNPRRREKEVLSCEMCHARVRKAQMGKHLLSHYHCRVAGINPRGPKARRFLLENMGNVVRQCPFQCASCRFYCNTQETFLIHWRSDLHTKTLEKISGSYRCGSCDFWCADGDTMETHLLSTSHCDVVSMMNGSVPVVISRQQALPCGSCNRQFRYNLQLRLHVKETGHKESFTASDQYQRRITCNMCPQVVRSLVSLQRHQLTCHINKEDENDELDVSTQPTPYFCSFCSMNFATAQEAVRHRRTSNHKEIVKAQKSVSKENSESMFRGCPHCDEKQSTLTEHKDHLLDRHPDLCHRCPQCGILFALSQDVTRHTRDNKCSKTKEDTEPNTTIVRVEWICSICNFLTDSQAEFIFHEALHEGSVQSNKDEDNNGKSTVKYRCPLCKKIFRKVSLRNHIRSHTGERPFSCAKCFVSFVRRSDLNAHQRNCSSTDWPNEIRRKRSFTCSECNGAFYTKAAVGTVGHASPSVQFGPASSLLRHRSTSVPPPSRAITIPPRPSSLGIVDSTHLGSSTGSPLRSSPASTKD
ncbi:hypothetical protein HZH68_016065 [Vespula germanica]|uniref:C2H2-type domain-containing protein n=1 Tax=Vespula germanica TaxID=30212 RepID=A0A834J480_VESGE|nr:hypothetical protein HZH68_016065 [Vespula germanica]